MTKRKGDQHEIRIIRPACVTHHLNGREQEKKKEESGN